MSGMHCLVIDDQTIFLDLLASLVESFPEIAKVSKADGVQTALAISGHQKATSGRPGFTPQSALHA